MAEEPKSAPLTTVLVADPARPPRLRLLFGLVGSCSESEFRVYLDATLSVFVDVPKAALVHQIPLEDPLSLGASYVWVQADAQLKVGPAELPQPGCHPCRAPCMPPVIAPGCHPCRPCPPETPQPGCHPCHGPCMPWVLPPGFQAFVPRACNPCPSPWAPSTFGAWGSSWGEF
jgi:hypothetical protein